MGGKLKEEIKRDSLGKKKTQQQSSIDQSPCAAFD